jgi:DNA (cytosine-5)-methyltransferase 1
MNKERTIEAIDLFCGIGGLTYGLKKAGINVLAGFDNDESCAFSYEKNNNSEFICADISDYDFEDMKGVYSDDSFKVVVGCAPCQPFSSHTHKAKKREKDSRWNLINYFIKAIKTLEPDVISMENVRGITKTEVFRNFVKRIKRMNYVIDYNVVYCPDYGIPQNRSRLVLLASRLGKIPIPEKTHLKDNYVTVRKTIGTLPKIKSGEISSDDSLHRAKNLSPLNIERIRQSKPNGTWRGWDESLLPECYRKKSGQTYVSVYGRMGWDGVSPTITTQFFNYGSGRFGHPEQDRALSIREGALLQTFPVSYDFGDHVSMTTIARQIGNAVPPRLGEVIGKTIKEHVKKYHEN